MIKDLLTITDKGAIAYRLRQFRPIELSDDLNETLEFYLSEDEAREALKNLERVVGYMIELDRVFYDVDTIEDIEELNDLWDESIDDCESLECEDTYQGKDIKGAIIVEWSYERYVGYARKFKRIGYAGMYPFDELLHEADLITNNEETTFKSNFSLLVDSDEVNEMEDADAMLLRVTEELHQNMWKWNNSISEKTIIESLDLLF